MKVERLEKLLRFCFFLEARKIMSELYLKLGMRLAKSLDEKGLLSSERIRENQHSFTIIKPATLVPALNIELCIRSDLSAVLSCTIVQDTDPKQRGKILEALNTLNGVTYFLKYILSAENAIVGELSFYLPDDCDQAEALCLKVLDHFSVLIDGAILLILRVANPNASETERIAEYFSEVSPSKLH
jgi:hypothetical protein